MKRKTIANFANIALIIAFAVELVPNICNWVAGKTTSYMDSVFLCILIILWNIREIVDRYK